MKFFTIVGVIVFAVFMVSHIYFVESGNTKYQVVKGWKTNATFSSCMVGSVLQCAAFIANETASLTQDLNGANFSQMYQLASYNRTSFDCRVITSLDVNNSLILQASDNDDDLILWNATNCESMDVFVELVDTVMVGYELGSESFEDLQVCIEFCRASYPYYQSINFNYASQNVSGGSCVCKNHTQQLHQKFGYSLEYGQGWSYYENLCDGATD